MAYGLGRPSIIGEDETILNCRRFLEHPLSLPTDVRLAMSVELLAIRGATICLRLACGFELSADGS